MLEGDQHPSTKNFIRAARPTTHATGKEFVVHLKTMPGKKFPIQTEFLGSRVKTGGGGGQGGAR